LTLTGPAGQTDAVRLAAHGALRVDAGVVALGTPPKAIPEIAAQTTATMIKTMETNTDLTTLLGDERIDVVCLGPAFSRVDAACAASKQSGAVIFL